jgi:hypothetical protein
MRILLTEMCKAFNAMRKHTRAMPANTVVSWNDIGYTIGQKSLDKIVKRDCIQLAEYAVRTIRAADKIIVAINGEVYTDHPINISVIDEWRALKPALLRVLEQERVS